MALTDPQTALPAYFQGNPDVAAAYQANQFGLTPEQFAQQHYNTYGQAEGRTGFEQPAGIGSLAPTTSALAETPTAPSTPAFDPTQGIFQKVFDPTTGREFISPAQAYAAGVTNYITSLPSDFGLPASLQGKTPTDIAALASNYGMTPEQFINAERQGALRYQDQTSTRNAVSTQSGGLTPDQLVSKLQAYKDKPPATAQEFADQQALWADYANRYANSSWNYANMGGKSQDYSLKPADYLKTQFTGYSDLLNEYLSGMQQNTPEFSRVQQQLTAHPEISEAIKTVYGTDPKSSLFSASAGNLQPTINNLASEIKRIGKDAALKNFYKEQQNLVGFGTDNWFGGKNMGTEDWAEYQRLINEYTPLANEQKWQQTTNRYQGLGGLSDATVWRDPTSGAGIGVQVNEDGTPVGLSYYDRSGQKSVSSIFSTGELLKNAELLGIDLSNIGGLQDKIKSAGVDISPGKIYKDSDYGLNLDNLQEQIDSMASQGWLDQTLSHLKWQDQYASDAGFTPPPPNVASLIPEKYTQYARTAERLNAAKPVTDWAYVADKYLGEVSDSTSKAAQDDVARRLKDLGASDEQITQAFEKQKQNYETGIADKVFGTFGTDSLNKLPTAEGILSGFAALNRGDITQDQAKEILGEKRFQNYERQLGTQLKNNIFASLQDGSLSGAEAVDTIRLARELGIDADRFSELTGYKKDLFNAIESGYGDTLKSFYENQATDPADKTTVDSTLGRMALALGATDADIAKATGMSVDAVKSQVEPIRGFSDRIKNLVSKENDDATSEAYTRLVQEGRANAGIDSLYSKQLDELEQYVNGLNEKWNGTGGVQAEKVFNQVKGLTDKLGGKNWTGSWSGQGGEGAMRAATDILLKSGIEDLRDLKVEEGAADEEGNKTYKLVDKDTGKTIATSSDGKQFVLHSYDTGNFFKGESKQFGVMMTPEGVPVPYQTTQKEGLIYSPVFPIMASLLLPGVGSALSGGIASVGGSSLAAGTLANTALTQGILGAGMAGITGGNVGKSFLTSSLTPVISTGVSSMLPTGMDPGLAKIATNVGTSAVTGALSGNPVNLGNMALNAGVQYGAQQLPFNLTPQQLNLLGGIATPLIQGKDLNPVQLAGILANYGIQSQKAQQGAR